MLHTYCFTLESGQKLAVSADMSSAQCSVDFESRRNDTPNMIAAQLNRTMPTGRATAMADARAAAAPRKDCLPIAGW